MIGEVTDIDSARVGRCIDDGEKCIQEGKMCENCLRSYKYRHLKDWFLPGMGVKRLGKEDLPYDDSTELPF